MSEPRDRNWLDPSSPADAALASLLDAGRREQPSAAQLQALAKRLGPTFDGPGPGGGGGGGEGGAAPLQVASAVGPATLAIAACGIIALCGMWLFNRSRADDAPAGATASEATTAARDPRAATSAAAAPIEPAVAPAPVDAGAQPDPEPTPRRARPGAPAPALDPAAELALLEQAHRALDTAPARALALIGSHERRFPASQFAQERELIAIRALLALGQQERARSRGERFLAAYPRSSHARKVRALIAPPAAPAPSPPAQPSPPAGPARP